MDTIPAGEVAELRAVAVAAAAYIEALVDDFAADPSALVERLHEAGYLSRYAVCEVDSALYDRSDDLDHEHDPSHPNAYRGIVLPIDDDDYSEVYDALHAYEQDPDR